jgi:hypothetical protein
VFDSIWCVTSSFTCGKAQSRISWLKIQGVQHLNTAWRLWTIQNPSLVSCSNRPLSRSPSFREPSSGIISAPSRRKTMLSLSTPNPNPSGTERERRPELFNRFNLVSFWRVLLCSLRAQWIASEEIGFIRLHIAWEFRGGTPRRAMISFVTIQFKIRRKRRVAFKLLNYFLNNFLG